MQYSITTFVHHAMNTTIAAACLAALIADARPARGEEFFQEGGSRLYVSRTFEPDGEDVEASGDLLAADDSQRSPIPSVGMDGDTLVISSIGGWHTVYIIGVEGKPGAVTVHFDDWAMQLFFDVSHIVVDLPGGNQFLALLQVNVTGDVMISAGDGDNQFFLGYHTYDPNLIGGNLFLTAGHGANDVLFEESWVLGNADFGMGDGGNDLVIGLAGSPSDLGVVVLGDAFVGTGTGHDSVEVTKSWFDGHLEIDTGDGNDTVILGTHYATGSAIAGNVFNGGLDVTTGHGDDATGLTDNTAYGPTSITMGHDDDELLLGAGFPPNDFYGPFTAHGGSGQDTLDDDPANFYADPPQFHSFEQ